MSARQEKRARKQEARRNRLVSRELDRTGITARVAAAKEASRQPRFTGRLRRAIQKAETDAPMTNLNQVRDLVKEVLVELGCDMSDVAIKLFWRPPSQLDIRFYPDHPSVMAAMRASEERLPT